MPEVCCGNYLCHAFEPRHEEVRKIDADCLGKIMDACPSFHVGEIVKEMNVSNVSKNYLFDICTRCGTKIIK